MNPVKLLKIRDHDRFLAKIFETVKNKRSRTALNRLWIETHHKPGAGDEYRRMRMRTWAKANQAEMYEYKNNRHTKYNFRLGDEKEEWAESRIRTFLSLQSSETVDREMAAKLNTSIPMVYYLRRKLNLIKRERPSLVKSRKSAGADSVRKSSLISLMMLGEARLKKALGVRR